MNANDKAALGRKFKHFVLAHVRQAPGWEAYYLAKGWKGKTNALTRDEINQAAIDLGVDKRALWTTYKAEFGANAGAAESMQAQAIVAGEGDEAEGDARDAKVEQEAQAKGALNMAEDARVEAIMALGEDAGDGSKSAFEGQDAKAVIDDALAPYGAHITTYLAEHLRAALAPIAEAATRGPRTVTKTVRAPAFSADAGAGETIVNVTKRETLRALFGFKSREGGKAYAHALDNCRVAVCDYFDAPAFDRDYVWPVNFAATLGIADATGQNAWFAGDAGVGKTEGVRQYAALTKRPFFRVPFNRTAEPMDLLGETGLVEGKSVWKDRAFTRAFRTPFAVVLLDEPCLLRSGTLAFVQTALDTRVLHLPTGEDVQCAEGVMFVVCDNSLGVGDDSGRYVDVAPVNAAFLDRFAYREEIKFLDPADEAVMISRRTGLALDAVTPMIAYASLTRENARSGKLTLGLTPRRLLAWARAVVAGLQSARAFDMCVINGSSPEDLECLRVLAETGLKSEHAVIDAIARGLAPPVPAPVPSGLGEMFPPAPEENA